MSKSVVTALSVLLFASCSHTDLHDPDAADEAKKAQEEALIQQKKQEYEANFVKKFGAVDPNQSWDFSSGMPTYSLPAGYSLPADASRGVTRADYQRTNSEEYYEFPAATINKMHEVFVEKRNNQDLGTNFVMTVPGNDFTIVPMYMGTSIGAFQLWMHVDGIGEIKVWDKWENMQVKAKTNSNWINVYNYNSTNNCTGVAAIRSKYYTFSGLPEGAVMHFYLKITQEASQYNHLGEELGSLNNYMRSYKFDKAQLPKDLPNVTNPEMMIIGCEDASTKNSDWDYNDVVFMIYGEPYVPNTFAVDDIESTYSKRYMIEDLGATDDFDFNDVVVDVYETYTQKKTTSSSGTITWDPIELKEQKAIVRHLGGVLPFDLTIGKTTLPTMGSKETFQTSPNEEFEIEGWDRAVNNIGIKVYQSAGSQTAVQVNFPQTGAVPMIIATDTDVEWAVERVEFNWKPYMPDAE